VINRKLNDINVINRN